MHHYAHIHLSEVSHMVMQLQSHHGWCLSLHSPSHLKLLQRTYPPPRPMIRRIEYALRPRVSRLHMHHHLTAKHQYHLHVRWSLFQLKHISNHSISRPYTTARAPCHPCHQLHRALYKRCHHLHNFPPPVHQRRNIPRIFLQLVFTPTLKLCTRYSHHPTLVHMYLSLRTEVR